MSFAEKRENVLALVAALGLLLSYLGLAYTTKIWPFRELIVLQIEKKRIGGTRFSFLIHNKGREFRISQLRLVVTNLEGYDRWSDSNSSRGWNDNGRMTGSGEGYFFTSAGEVVDFQHALDNSETAMKNNTVFQADSSRSFWFELPATPSKASLSFKRMIDARLEIESLGKIIWTENVGRTVRCIWGVRYPKNRKDPSVLENCF